jgi:hypothetical protein
LSLHRSKPKEDAVRHALAAVIVLATASTAPAFAQTISERDCRRLERHVPAPDVAYRPGVDVRGRTVAPADLNPSVPIVPERLALSLGVDLRERLGLPPDIIADLPLGVIEIDRGTVLFNGRPIAPDVAAGLAAACAEARRR